MSHHQLIPFTFQRHTIRVVEQGGQPWFVAKDVAAILEYRDAEKITRLLDEDEKGTHIVGTPGGPQEMAILSESGLYHAIFLSRKPQAAAFRRWVTAEVLPAIRRTGGYGRPAEPEKLTIEVTKDEYIHLLERRAGVSLRPRPTRRARRDWTPEEDRALLDLHAQGLGPTEIGRRLGRSAHSVRGRLQRIHAQPSLALEGGAA